MKLVVEGVMGGNLPWSMVLVGVFLALGAEILGVPVLPFAIGVYLPIHLSLPIMAGGLVRWYLERRKYQSGQEKENVVQAGVLYTSGMIAGEGVIGILLAVFAVIEVRGNSLEWWVDLSARFGIHLGNLGGLLFFVALLISIFAFTAWNRKLRV